MVLKCKNCGHKIIKYPLWDGQEAGEKFAWKKLKVFNLIRMDAMSLFYLVIVLILAWLYFIGMQECQQAASDPCGYADGFGCCDPVAVELRRNPGSVYIPPNLWDNIEVDNGSG